MLAGPPDPPRPDGGRSPIISEEVYVSFRHNAGKIFFSDRLPHPAGHAVAAGHGHPLCGLQDPLSEHDRAEAGLDQPCPVAGRRDIYKQRLRALGTSITADKLIPIAKSDESIQYYGDIWRDQTKQNDLLSVIFYADTDGVWFSSDAQQDFRFSIKHNSKAIDPRTRVWFKGAEAMPGEYYWSPPL